MAARAAQSTIGRPGTGPVALDRSRRRKNSVRARRLDDGTVVLRSNGELKALGLAYVDDAGRHRSDGHHRFVRATHWEAGEGHRDTLDTICAQLRAVHADVRPQTVSAILNRRRMPALVLAGAIQRAFGIEAGEWTTAKGAQLGVDRESSTLDGERSRTESTEEACVATAAQ
jgi:hypothetical protein